MVSDSRHAGHILLAIRYRKNFAPRPIQSIISTSPIAIDASKGEPHDHGSRQVITFTPMCTKHVKSLNDQLRQDSYHTHPSGVTVDLVKFLPSLLNVAEFDVHPDIPSEPGPRMARPLNLFLASTWTGCPNKHPSCVPVEISAFPLTRPGATFPF
jgi:hypothetical protein